ncbi:hypothetical protein Paz_33 [Xylella phage Paz]|uniref:Uncharacterized protein n=1 Tax=Xylella phage Paz TaxID=1415145 RepID=V5Q9L7_9CAUD|nr:hypothetical protein Paz_33 [Xylella phage Paz]AHB12130.1 hypothetical protein Paz_33 [Xylella phage Paz]
MATIAAKLPFAPGTTVQLSAAVDVYPDKAPAYVCFYQIVGTTLYVQVRVQDDSPEVGTFDLFIPVTGIEALGTP